MTKRKKINLTEEELVKTIDRVVNSLAYKFKFGYFDVEDIKQQGRLFALEGLKQYDGVRPLFNFLKIHVHNRLCNFKRDNFARLNSPCDTCRHKKTVHNHCTCSKYAVQDECKTYRRWEQRNRSKINLMLPVDISNLEDNEEPAVVENLDVGGDIDYNDLLAAIEDKIPVNQRGLFLRLKYNIKLTQTEKKQLQIIVLEILDERKR
jgi:DNA-directed RNA polymerase specialized sigma24 family protein